VGRKPLSVRARWFWGIGVVAAAVAVVAALVFQPWLLFVNVRVDDPIPVAVQPSVSAPTTAAAEPDSTQSPSPTPLVGPVDLLTGSFISHEHDTSGTVRVIQLPDGARQLAIQGLATSNGPDVHVWLSAGPVIEGFDGWFTAAGYEHIDLGPIKGNLGDQLYDIPADVDLAAFRTVDLWCEQFAVSFGAAALG
jgi:Electron transfer DM13